MTNSLRKLAKDLKAFAKRCKDFKYTEQALFVFLLCGIVGFADVTTAPTDKAIQNQRQEITTSIGDMRQQFKRVKSENDKLMKNYNLELIQLMEQGDHVVKSPWSSWQYGINTFYNDWRGTYKGKGNKIKDNGVYKRSQTLSRYLESPVIEKNANNTTTLGFVYEPNAEIPISASITPKSISKTNPNIQKNVAIASLPSFEPRTVESPTIPVVSPPDPNISISLTLNATSKGSGGQTLAINNGSNSNKNGVFEGVTIKNGKIAATRTQTGYSTWDYTIDSGLEVINTSQANIISSEAELNGKTPGSTITVSRVITGRETLKNGFFQTSGNGNSPSSFILNNAMVDYISQTPSSQTEELVHQDVHHGINASAVNSAITTSTLTGFAGDFNDIVNVNLFDGTGTRKDEYNVFGNSGTITMSGPSASFSNSYIHDDHANGVILNKGSIKLNSIDEDGHAIFVVSPAVASTNGFQYYYNGSGGNITSNTTKTAVLFLNNTGGKRYIGFTNQGTIKLTKSESAGVYLKVNNGTVVHLNFSDDTSAGSQETVGDPLPGTATRTMTYVTGHSGKKYNKLNGAITDGTTAEAHAKPIEISGDSSAGLYVPVADSFFNGVFAAKLTNTGNAGIDPTTNKMIKTGSAGIYTASSMDLQGHYLFLDGGSNNVGVYPTDSNAIVNLGLGRIRMDNGIRNAGIVVKSNGSVYSESDMLLNGGKGNTAIFAKGTANNVVSARKIETNTPTTDAIFIYADGAKVKTHEDEGGLKVAGEISTTNPVKYDASNPENTGQTTGAVYAVNGAEVDISRSATNTFGSGANVDITGANIKEYDATTGTYSPTKNYTGFGLFASNSNTKIKAKYNTIKVTNGSTAVASIKGANVDLSNGKAIYSGEGYALYTGNPDVAGDTGNINLTDGTLELGGKAIGFVKDVSGANNWVDLTRATINVTSDDVIIADLKNSLGTGIVLNATNGSPSLKDQVLGVGVNVVPSSGITKYKYALVDGATINIQGDIDKADTTAGSDSEVFTRRLQAQNSNINVASGKTVKAHLASADLTTINPDLTVPVGLDISASGNSTNRSTTGVNVANGATITVDRTDSGNGGVGAYVNYGKVTNDGKIEVEKLTPNDHAVGIYATNGTTVNNNATGTVEVGGKDSIGILGLSYRIDSKNNVVYEKFKTGGAVSNGIGLVDITNKGKITLDGDNALGIYAKNNSLDATGVNAGYLRNSTSDTSATNDGEITLAGKNAIGMITEGGKITNDSNGKITINGQEGVAMYGTVAKDSATPTVNKVHSQLINKGTITLADTTATTPIIGMFTNDPDTSITTSGTINVGKKSYGVYGASNNVSMTGGAINVGDDGVGIFATGSSDTTTPTSTVTLSGGTITVGTNKAVGVFIADDANHPLKTTVTNTGTNVNVGNDSFGYVVDSTTGTDLILGSATNKLISSLDTDSVYVYSNDKNGFVYSNTDITTNGGKIYGLYTAGRAENYGNMDLRGGTGNVGIYSTGTSPTGVGATNYGTITVGGTNLTAKEYGIGMATGYYNETTGAISNEGLIENRGTLNVVGDNSIGMYAVGSGSKAINAAGATIDISGKNATGMYIDHGAEGINYGTIKSTGSATGIKGVATVNGGYIKNYGTIAITSPDGIGIYQDAASSLANKNVPGNVSGTKKAVYTATSTDEKYIVSPKGSLLIQNPPRTPRLVVNGKEVELRGLDTNVASPTPSYVTAGVTTLDLSLPEFAEFKNSPSNAQASELGMYIDTSGVNYTNPIQGLNNLIGLDAINLIIGTEAAKYTDAKAIEIGDNILTPYNNAISSLTTTGTKLNINAAGLTWLAQPVQGATKPIETLYMVKIPYTYFTSPKDENTYNFLDGLEQRYGVDGYGARGAREKLLFNKLNGIGKGETHIFTQAVDEMKGHQYANTQQRINETGSLLDDEFKYLHDEWRNPSKQNNKIKIFGIRNEYNTDTAGIIDYTSNAYGVAYVHEDETVKLGNSSGWYAGAVNNRFRFKDNGKSKENQTMLKAGIFKTMSPYMDHNGSLRWTVAGDVFVGQNEMKRRFLVVDDIFSAKGDYTSYGAAFKTDLGYDIRMSERTHLRPYGALKMEYGRFNNIKEDDGEMRLEVKGNDYFSVKPEVGVQFKYVQPLAVRTQLSVGLTAAYENELGKLQERRNQARVGYTDAGWYNLEQEKENRRGNGKFDFNLGVDNTRFGVTVNAGYDTKGSNIRGGIGFRAIY